MNTKKQKSIAGSNDRPVLKPVLFAVIRSDKNQAFHPLSDCVLVVDDTNKGYIIAVGSKDDPTPKKDLHMAYPRKYVLFYTHKDLRQAVSELNKLVEAGYKEHMDNVERLLEAFKNANEPV